MDKVFEQLVGTQLTAGFDSHMYEYSSAYRKVHSCETTLINLVEGWRKARDKTGCEHSIDRHVKGFLLATSAIAFKQAPKHMVSRKA